MPFNLPERHFQSHACALFKYSLEATAGHTPCARLNTAVALLQKNEEIVLFGGELWDQAANKVYVYDDVYKFNPAKERWARIVSPGPHPRSACASAVYKGCLYIFGGEFTSPNQNKFRHFRCAAAATCT
jgi:N-acetylneuraminic acid mutarotase